MVKDFFFFFFVLDLADYAYYLLVFYLPKARILCLDSL